MNRTAFRATTAALLAALTLGTAVPSLATDLHDDCTLDGAGTQAEPWLIFSDIEFACLGTSSYPGASRVYFRLEVDVTMTTDLPLLSPQVVSTPYEFDGQGQTVTISGVSGFHGIFHGGVAGRSLAHLRIHAQNADLAPYAGWLSATDANGQIDDITSDGDVSQYGGGIIGASAAGSRINAVHASGNVAENAGGIVGASAYQVEVTGARFDGTSISQGGGGVFGADAAGGVAQNIASTGAIFNGAGGVFGADSVSAVVLNAYQTGDVANSGGAFFASGAENPVLSNSYASGVIAAEARLAQDPVIGALLENNVYWEALNSFETWSDVNARSVLTGFGPYDEPSTVWVQCEPNTPFDLKVLLPEDPCPADSSSGGGSSGGSSAAQLASTGVGVEDAASVAAVLLLAGGFMSVSVRGRRRRA